MKNVKIMLTAIALFAVVGGALAFKAKKIPFTFYKFSTVTQNCDEQVSLLSTTVNPTTTLIDYTTTPTPGHCQVDARFIN